MGSRSVFRIFLLLFLTFAISNGGPALAQPEVASAPPVAQTTPLPAQSVAAPAPSAAEPQMTMPASTDEEVTIMRDDFAGKYNISSLQNLSKLYWRLGAFDFDDDLAVGNYLKINDCKIFTEYLNDDLEWKEIVKVMKEHLRRERDTYPLNFQFVLEQHLGRYDPALKGFPLVDRTGFKDAKRIEVSSIDQNRQICNDYAAIKDYPKSLIILLPKPFTLNFLPVDEHVAQAYILRKKAEFAQIDEAVRLTRYERTAYLRLRVSFSQYHGNLRGENAELMAILFGRIDGYEIFEDAAQKRLMVSVDLTKQDGEAKALKMSMPSPEMGGQTTARPETGEKPRDPAEATSSSVPVGSGITIDRVPKTTPAPPPGTNTGTPNSAPPLR